MRFKFKDFRCKRTTTRPRKASKVMMQTPTGSMTLLMELRPVDLFQTEDQEMGTEPLDGEENNDEADEDSDDIEEDEREGNGPMDIDGDRASRQLLRQMGNIRLMAMKEGMQINTNIPTNLRKEGCAVGPDGELLPADQIDFDHSPSTPTLRSSWLQPGDSSIGSIGGSTPAATTEGIV